MTAAILFRGHHYSKIGERRGTGTDWRKCIASHRKYLIGPLREMTNTRVDTFVVSYDTPFRTDVSADYNPVDQIWRKDGTQKSTTLMGLDMVCRHNSIRHYEVVVMCRFDIELKGDPFQHQNYHPNRINFLWREWNEKSWADHRRVPDALHFIPGRLLSGFRRGLEKTPSDVCLHLVYYPVAHEVGEENINIMHPEGFVDSNTDVMPNYFYHIVRTRE